MRSAGRHSTPGSPESGSRRVSKHAKCWQAQHSRPPRERQQESFYSCEVLAGTALQAPQREAAGEFLIMRRAGRHSTPGSPEKGSRRVSKHAKCWQAQHSRLPRDAQQESF